MANFNFNKVILGGRLTAVPEIKQTPQGISVCTFDIAVNRKYQKDNNNNEQQADFIRCVAWRGTAELISKYFRKGSSICIVGALQTRNWTDQQGVKHYATEINVDEALFVDSKADDNAQHPQQQNYTPSSAEPTGNNNAPVMVGGTDDDLPF